MRSLPQFRGSRTRRVLRLILIAFPLSIFLSAAALIYGLPLAMRAGWLDEDLKNSLASTLGASVVFTRATTDEHGDVILDDLTARPGSGPVREIQIPRLRLSFTPAFPLGKLRAVHATSPRIVVQMDRLPTLSQVASRISDLPGIALDDGELILVFPDMDRVLRFEGAIENDGPTSRFEIRGKWIHAQGTIDLRAQSWTLEEFAVLGLRGSAVGSLDLSSFRSRLSYGPRIEPEIRSLLRRLAGLDAAGELTAGGTLELTRRGEWAAEIHCSGRGLRWLQGSALADTKEATWDLRMSNRLLHVRTEARHPRIEFGAWSFRARKSRFEAWLSLQQKGGWDTIRFEIQEGRATGGPLKGSEFSLLDLLVKNEGQQEISLRSEIHGLRVEEGTRVVDLSQGPVDILARFKNDGIRWEIPKVTIQIPSLGKLVGNAMGGDDGESVTASLEGRGLSADRLARILQERGILPDGLALRGAFSGNLTIRRVTRKIEATARLQISGEELTYGPLRAPRFSATLQVNYAPEGRSVIVNFATDRILLGGGSLEEVRGHIPIAHGNAPVDPNGFLSFRKITFGGLCAPETRLTISLGPAGLSIPDPITLQGEEGRLEIAGIAVQNPFASNAALAATIAASEIPLEQVLPLFGVQRPPAGRLDLYSSRLRLSSERLDLDGSVSLRMLRGEVSLETPSILQPFSDRGSYQARVTFRRISLEELWSWLVGRGHLQGTVSGKAWLDLQPSGEPNELELQMESDGGKENRSIDLRAFRLLVRTLQGEEALREMRELPSDSLSYSTLGVWARVDRSGIMTLRGKYYLTPQKTGLDLHKYTWEELRSGRSVEGATEYLMMGSGRVQINVINANPTGRISWQDLSDRFKRGDR